MTKNIFILIIFISCINLLM